MRRRCGSLAIRPGAGRQRLFAAPALAVAGLWLLAPSVTLAGPARLDLEIDPDEADVYLDGVYKGVVDDFDGHPDYLWVEPGRHTLELRKRKYQTLRILFAVEANEERRFPQKLYKLREGEPELVELNMLPPETAAKEEKSGVALLKFLVEPEDAALWIDGAFVGVAAGFDGDPDKAQVTSGKHRLELTRPGYQTWAGDVVLGPQQERTIRVTLEPER